VHARFIFLPPKQKLRIAVENDIVRRVGMIQSLLQVQNTSKECSNEAMKQWPNTRTCRPTCATV